MINHTYLTQALLQYKYQSSSDKKNSDKLIHDFLENAMGHKPNPAQDDTPPPVPVPRTHTSGVSQSSESMTASGKKRPVVDELPQSSKKHQKGPNSAPAYPAKDRRGLTTGTDRAAAAWTSERARETE